MPTHSWVDGISDNVQVSPPSLEYADSLDEPPKASALSLTATNRVCVYAIEYQFPVVGYAPPIDQEALLSVDLAFNVVPLPAVS